MNLAPQRFYKDLLAKIRSGLSITVLKKKKTTKSLKVALKSEAFSRNVSISIV